MSVQLRYTSVWVKVTEADWRFDVSVGKRVAEDAEEGSGKPGKNIR